MTEIDPQVVRDFARRAILSVADEVDYLGIGEQFSDEEGWPDEESAYDAMLAAVDAERRKATVIVTWPDEQAGPTVGQLRHIVDEQAHRIQSGLDRIAELEAERDKLAAELRWIDEQGADAADLALVQARALTDNGNRTPLADVMAEFGMKPGCNHGSDMQCVECVPDDGVSFRPLGLGPAGSES